MEAIQISIIVDTAAVLLATEPIYLLTTVYMYVNLAAQLSQAQDQSLVAQNTLVLTYSI